MKGDPQLVPRDALAGQKIVISVSESADLQRLGLSERHLELTIAELSRAIAIAGGVVIYAGGINVGFTTVVLEQAERYGHATGSFEHVIPYSEHATRPVSQLTDYTASLGVKSTVKLLDIDGVPAPVRHGGVDVLDVNAPDQQQALSAMRRYTSEIATARVVVGGKVSGFAGEMPGVAEEAAATLRAAKPLYVAGGFGGAATLVGSIIAPELYDWLPSELPVDVQDRVRDLVASALDVRLPPDGLSDPERALLAETHRPSDIATLVVLGLARHLDSSSGDE
ncbi:hypothetical protein EEW87_008230 [Janibacter melonis]|uniref:Uncharacterized protein n=1 Tax=Janibacter melonis TaxID=262209 RepID=A0A5P8FM93_9MICO|nr:hypothetical protein [Janibacter melonis]QFQ30311.2 hypothetical protein EEW87_008230 [Janibacter melonis]